MLIMVGLVNRCELRRVIFLLSIDGRLSLHQQFATSNLRRKENFIKVHAKNAYRAQMA